MLVYKQTTHDIEVQVQPTYLQQQSNPMEDLYVWAYEIEIANHGGEAVRLMTRHWRITNAHGQVLEVRGAGVVGDQPLIRPGEMYSYTSFTNLATSSGFMLGTYEVVTEGGATLRIAIPPFSLDGPSRPQLLH
jgi:ApaG protein